MATSRRSPLAFRTKYSYEQKKDGGICYCKQTHITYTVVIICSHFSDFIFFCWFYILSLWRGLCQLEKLRSKLPLCCKALSKCSKKKPTGLDNVPGITFCLIVRKHSRINTESPAAFFSPVILPCPLPAVRRPRQA